MNRLLQLQQQGQSVWYDNIHRHLLHSGEFEQMIKEDGLGGVTTNPTIFEKAISSGDTYDTPIKTLLKNNPDLGDRDLFDVLAIEDVQRAADLFQGTYETSGHVDGMVSIEVSPELAYDTDATIPEANRLFQTVNRPNCMIKVPATTEGLTAIEILISKGINVNATLLFSVKRYRDVAESYILGLEKRLRRGQPLQDVASVASFFVSRVDTKVDGLLQERMEKAGEDRQASIRPLLGRIAIANAKMAYQAYLEIFGSERFAQLEAAGARPQRLLWGSTGTKNPAYSDTLYIDELIGPHTVNTIPPATYQAFKDHGHPRRTLDRAVDEARQQLAALATLDIDLDAVTDVLEEEGVRQFADSYHSVIGVIGEKRRQLEQP